MSKGIEVLEKTVLYKLLGAEGVEELRKEIINIIVNEVKGQLETSTSYIISPDDISKDLYEEVMKSVREEVIEEYKQKIKEQMDKKFEYILGGE